MAVAREPTGLDVEALRSDLDVVALAVEALADEERAVLEALPAAERVAAFLTYWTRKEAVLKATGRGLSTPPADLTVSGPAYRARLLAWVGAAARPSPMRLYDLDLGPGFVACVAVLCDLPLRIEVSEATLW